MEETNEAETVLTTVALAALGCRWRDAAERRRQMGRRRRSADQSARLRRRRRRRAAASKPYDGGQATGAPTRPARKSPLVDVPKLIGIGYFNATSKGMQDAAKELGNVKVTTDGPTEAKIDEQIKFIDNYITRGVDGILFAANDPVAIAPVLKKALVEGHPRRRLRRQLDAGRARMVRQPGAVQRHRQGDDRLHGQGDRRGQGLRDRHLAPSPRPIRRAGSPKCQAYAAKCHPKLKWLETVEAQEDNVLSFNQATTLINKYGDKLSGLFGMTSVATPASAEAVTKAKLCGKVAVVGLATPNAMKPYVNADCVKSVVLWNPVDLGYAATYVMRAVVDGKLKPGATVGRGGQARQADRWSTAARSCSARRSSSPRTTSRTSTSDSACAGPFPREGRRRLRRRR